MRTLNNVLQRVLLVLGVLALIFLLVEIGLSLAATQHGKAPARVVPVTAGPYRFTVSLYDDPARAGFALPFAIAPQGTTSGSWTYQVTSIPVGTSTEDGGILLSGGYVANPVRASVTPDPQVQGGVQGVAEITVQGAWNLHVIVDGPSGQQTFDVPVRAVTLPAIPLWLGWTLGFIPVFGFLVFLLMQRGKRQKGQSATIMG